MRRVAVVAFVLTVTSCSGSVSVRTVATIPPPSCALLEEHVARQIPGSEVLRPPFNGTLLDHLLGFFTIDADWETIVYMRADAAPESVEAIRGQLSSDPRVASFVYLDHDAAYAEFESLFADQPAISHSLTPAETPTSFKLKLKDRNMIQAIDDAFNAKPGVYDVIAPAESTKVARAALFLAVKPRLATLRVAGVTPALLRLVTADDRLADRMVAQASSPIVGANGVFSEAEAAQLAEDANAVRAEIARDCNSGASS